MKSKIKVSALANDVFNDLISHGAEVYLVGGCVRDHIMHIPTHDIDVEVYHLSYELLVKILSQYGHVNTFGSSFAIVQLDNLKGYDFALPRRECKIGDKHTDFFIDIDQDLPINKAILRRDFTMNALMYNVKTQEIIDLIGGIDDLLNGVIKVVDEEKFIEDPLRILRAASFMSRFEMSIDDKTKQLCQLMVKDHLLDHLTLQRVYNEYCKILMSHKPSLGLEFLREIKGLPSYLYDLVKTDQRRDYHPEGSVWNHTMLVVDIGAMCKHKSSDPLAFMWSCLLHDIGKPAVTSVDGHAYAHNESGVECFKDVKMITSLKQRQYIETMILYHMHLMNMSRNHSKDLNYLRFLKKIDGKIPLNDLILISKCDKFGRGRIAKEQYDEFETFINDKIQRLGDKALTPIVRGEDLIACGVEDKQNYKTYLEEAYDLQLQGLSKEKILRRYKHGS